ASAPTPAAPAPTAPSDLSASAASTTEVDLAWSATGNQQGFNILRSTDDSTFTQIATVGANVAAYADTTVSGSTTYYYEVEAYNAAGTSNASSVASATTASPAPNPTPTPTPNPTPTPPVVPPPSSSGAGP